MLRSHNDAYFGMLLNSLDDILGPENEIMNERKTEALFEVWVAIGDWILDEFSKIKPVQLVDGSAIGYAR